MLAAEFPLYLLESLILERIYYLIWSTFDSIFARGSLSFLCESKFVLFGKSHQDLFTDTGDWLICGTWQVMIADYSYFLAEIYGSSSLLHDRKSSSSLARLASDILPGDAVLSYAWRFIFWATSWRRCTEGGLDNLPSLGEGCPSLNSPNSFITSLCFVVSWYGLPSSMASICSYILSISSRKPSSLWISIP